MVATVGPGWRLAPSLIAYVNEANKYFPGRDKASDGSIGDASHQARPSDHNPDWGTDPAYVHAVDLDEDLTNTIDLKAFAEILRTRRDGRIKYVIYEGRMFASYDTSSRKAWTWGDYSGLNDHLHHLHLSILHTTRARNDTTAWGFANLKAKPTPPPIQPEPEDDDMRLIVKGKDKAEWWITDGITKRHVNDRAEAGTLAFNGLAKWDEGEAFVWPQASVDDITTVPRGKTLA